MSECASIFAQSISLSTWYRNDINLESLSRQYLELLDSCVIISLHEASRNSPPHNIVRYDTLTPQDQSFRVRKAAAGGFAEAQDVGC